MNKNDQSIKLFHKNIHHCSWICSLIFTFFSRGKKKEIIEQRPISIVPLFVFLDTCLTQERQKTPFHNIPLIEPSLDRLSIHDLSSIDNMPMINRTRLDLFFFPPSRLISRLRSVSLSIIVAERRKRTAERMAVANEPLVAWRTDDEGNVARKKRGDDWRGDLWPAREEFTIINRDFVTGRPLPSSPSSSTRVESFVEGCISMGTEVVFSKKNSSFWKNRRRFRYFSFLLRLNKLGIFPNSEFSTHRKDFSKFIVTAISVFKILPDPENFPILYLYEIARHGTNSTLNFLSKGKEKILRLQFDRTRYANIKYSPTLKYSLDSKEFVLISCNKLSYIAGMAGSMGQAGMGSYYGPAAAYGSLSAASMAAAAAAAAQQSAAAMSAGLAAPAQVSRCIS